MTFEALTINPRDPHFWQASSRFSRAQGRFTSPSFHLTLNFRPLAATVERVYGRPMIGRTSLEALYSRYSSSVWRRARRMLADDDAAKDVTQEVFLRVLAVGATNAFDASPMAWLYRVTTNLCLNRLRDAKRRTEILSESTVQEANDGDADTQILVRRILARVPEELQSIAIFYYVDELSHDEIADILGVSRRTIGNRLATFHSVVNELVMREATS